MPVYLITEIEVSDPAGYEAYRARVGQSLAQFGARFMVRGGEIEVMEGNWQPKRMVMCEFESMDKVRAWYNSDVYGELKRLRQNTATMNMVAVEGL